MPSGKQAFHQFYEEFQDHQFTLGLCLCLLREGRRFPRSRPQLSRALEASLFRDDVP